MMRYCAREPSAHYGKEKLWMLLFVRLLHHLFYAFQIWSRLHSLRKQLKQVGNHAIIVVWRTYNNLEKYQFVDDIAIGEFKELN